MRYDQLPVEFEKKLARGAGIFVTDFTPSTGAVSAADIICSTSGGLSVEIVPTYVDDFEDADNVIKGSKEGNRLDSTSIKVSGTGHTVTNEFIKRLVGAADIGVVDTTKITPRTKVELADYETMWYITNYSDYTGTTGGGYVAIKFWGMLSTGGFKMDGGDKEKKTFPFEFTAFPSIYAPDEVPCEIYIKAGVSESGDYAMEFVSAAGTLTGDTALSGMTETPGAGESYVYQTGYNLIVPAAGAILAGSAWTSWNGTADITAVTGMDIVLAVILTATGAAQHAGKGIVVAKA